MGCLSAIFLGLADFIASQNSKRIGSLRSLTGMLLASSIIISSYILFTGNISNALQLENFKSILLGVLHGILMALALLLFFHALSIGKIAIVAPIIGAHPVFIILIYIFLGKIPTLLQSLGIILVILGVVTIGASGETQKTNLKKSKNLNNVIKISIISSILYAISLIVLQYSALSLLEINVLWLGRVFGLITVFTILWVKKEFSFKYSMKWWLIFIIHGFLDSVGLLFIIIGTSGGNNDALLVVIASTFPVITMFLAWYILKERITFIQKIGVTIIILSISYLAFVSKI